MKKILSLCLIMAMTIGASQAKKDDVVTTKFQTNVDCPNCTKKIMNKLPYEKGVKDVEVDLEKKIVTVSYDGKKSSDSLVMKSLHRLGVSATVCDK